MAPIRVPRPGGLGAFTQDLNLASTVTHILLLNGQAISVQLRISMHCIGFLMGVRGRPHLSSRPSGRGLPRPEAEGSAFGCVQNFVTSEKWKSRTFIAGTTISNDSSPVARTAGVISSTFFNISMSD